MKAIDIKRIACGGAGAVSSGFATVFALKGYDVGLFSIRRSSVDEAESRIQGNLALFTEKGLIERKEAAAAQKRISVTTELKTAVSDVQFIQEQFAEKYEVKAEMLSEIEKYAPENAIIASSTSGLHITEIQKGMKHPERLVGGHPYNNMPHLSPLVEVVKGSMTSEESAACAYEFYKMIGKTPVMVNREVSGFIASRLESALYRECIDLVMTGVCSVEDVDKAFTYGPGLNLGIIGPNLNLHLGGSRMGGIKSFLTAFHDLMDARLNEMANWTEEPLEWPEVAETGVLCEIGNRESYEGRTIEDITRFRDDMLIEILKLHKKF